MERILSTNADMPTFESRLPANCDSGPVAPTSEPSPPPENTDQATVQVVTAEVKLLQAVKVPARHAKRATGHTNVPLGEQDLILDPLQGNLNSEEVKATEALVKVSPQNEVAVLIESYESHPVILEAGTMLGTLHQVQTVNDEKLPEVLSKELDSLSLPENSKAELLELSSWKQQVMEQLDVEWCNTSAEEMEKLIALIEEFADVFALNAMEVGHTNLVQHHINTADHVPVKQASRRVPFSLRAKVEEMVKEMLDHGIIEHSTSPWASPIVLVSKHDGSTRFYVDYRRLNAFTKLDEFPLPRIDDSAFRNEILLYTGPCHWLLASRHVSKFKRKKLLL